MVCIQTKVSYKLLPAWQWSRLLSLLVYFFNVQSHAFKTDVKENYFCKVFEYTLFIIFESLLLTENECFLEIIKRKKKSKQEIIIIAFMKNILQPKFFIWDIMVLILWPYQLSDTLLNFALMHFHFS